MGLFSNQKKPCPICGNPTPRLLPQKFEEQPICKECEKKIDLPKERLNGMSLADFREYLVAYEENAALRFAFKATYSYSFGGAFSNNTFQLDEENGLIRLRSKEESWAIERHYLKSFQIYEDDRLLFENGDGTLKSHPSDVPERARALEPSVMAFQAQRREYERREQMERARRAGNETDEQHRERERVNNVYRPRFEDPRLVREFRIEMTFDHPYWTAYTDTVNAPSFDETTPSVEDYLESYRKKTDEWHLIAEKLMHMIDPFAGETRAEEAQAQNVTAGTAGNGTDAATEIKKFKELLDEGIITEEEFAAKKRQLLGL